MLVNALSCSEKLLFLYEIFQIDSNNQTCEITKKKGEKNKHFTKKAGAALVRTITSYIIEPCIFLFFGNVRNA